MCAQSSHTLGPSKQRAWPLNSALCEKIREMRNIKAIIILLTVIFVSACTSEKQFTASQVTPQKLPSGNEIMIKSISKVHFSEDEPALVLKYETNHEISDKAALQNEAKEIWIEFRKNVEASGLNNAVIQASKITKKFFIISTSKQYGTVYKKDNNGSWVNENT